MRDSIITWLFSLTILLLPVFLKAQSTQKEAIRDQFFRMNEVKEGALNLYFRLKPLDLPGNPVLLAYRGAASAASAGSVGGPQKKLQYFSRGKSELEQAVRLKPADAEIRFLRMATQLNAPGFLGYSGEIESDKKVILSVLSSADHNDPNTYLYFRIADFLLKTDILTPLEKKQLQLTKQELTTKN